MKSLGNRDRGKLAQCRQQDVVQRTNWLWRLALVQLLCLGAAVGCGSGDAGTVGQVDLGQLNLADAATASAASSTGPEKPAASSASTSSAPPATPALPAAGQLNLEKTSLKLGFIKLTDCAPIVIAKEKGFFAAEGLQVEVVAQPNWKTLLDNVIQGELDGAHMLSGQPLAATLGIGTSAHIVTAYTLDLNGNAVTVSNAVWEQMQQHDPQLAQPTPPHPISAASLVPIVKDKIANGQKLQMAVVFPVSTHNYQLRYWLAAAGIHPGMYSASDVGGRTNAEVEISVTPPPMMPATLEAGNIHGYCVGEPWNQQAVFKGIGVPVTTNYDIWRNGPEKVFGVTHDWAEKHSDTHTAVIKALIRAGKWLDEADGAGNFLNREEACRILARPDYVGADFEVIKNSMTGTFVFQKTDRRSMPEFNVFFKHYCTYPWYSDGIWFLTQMRRWGQIAEPQSAEWYHETVRKIYRPDVYRRAAELLLAEGHLTPSEIPPTQDGYRAPTDQFIDGVRFDPKDPLGYLKLLGIGNKE